MTQWRDQQEANLALVMAGFLDGAGYSSRYQDVSDSRIDPLLHFIRFGVNERRDPNRSFDSAWYSEHYPMCRRAGFIRCCTTWPWGSRTAQSASPVRRGVLCRSASGSRRQPAAVSYPHRRRARLPDGKAADDRGLPAILETAPAAAGLCVGRYRHPGLQGPCRDPPLPEIGACRARTSVRGDIIVVDDHSPEPNSAPGSTNLPPPGRSGWCATAATRASCDPLTPGCRRRPIMMSCC